MRPAWSPATMVRSAIECAAPYSGVAGESSDHGAGLQIPHFGRLVIGRGDGAPPVRSQRHATDKVEVAGERAQFGAVSRSHSLSVRSQEADTARCRSALSATSLTVAILPTS